MGWYQAALSHSPGFSPLAGEICLSPQGCLSTGTAVTLVECFLFFGSSLDTGIKCRIVQWLPWTAPDTSVACVFLSFTIFDPPFHDLWLSFSTPVFSQINNLPLITFSLLASFLLHRYPNLVFLITLCKSSWPNMVLLMRLPRRCLAGKTILPKVDLSVHERRVGKYPSKTCCHPHLGRVQKHLRLVLCLVPKGSITGT